MQHATIVRGVSFRKEPRRGQLEVLNHPKLLADNKLNVKLPTGYGKTYVAAGVYSILKHHGRVNRVLYICASEGQRDQFIKDAPAEFRNASVDGGLVISDVGYMPTAELLNRHRKNTHQIFAITVQALGRPTGADRVKRLLESGSWLIVIDEYHHYGIEKSWGKIISGLSRVFTLAMSATPYRPAEDSAFGEPDVIVGYREGLKDKAIKELKGHAYDYKIDAIGSDGELITYTTNELIKEAGGDDPQRIEKLRIERKMRWSPKYVSPLIRIPIERMMSKRTMASGFRLQALFSALCVSHAELICAQLKSLYSGLEVDWVGTGEDGKTAEENRKVLDQFCPTKDSGGTRTPTLDVLVHVGMAGEGLDATNVVEIVFVRSATLCNQVLQIIGRASRQIYDRAGNLIDTVADISFDRSTELGAPQKTAPRGYVGDAIMDAMDLLPAKAKDINNDDDVNEDEDGWPPDLPIEPVIGIVNIELIGIDSGDERIQRMARVMEKLNMPNVDFDGIKSNPEHPDWSIIIEMWRTMETSEAREFDEKSVISQWRSGVESALVNVTGSVIKIAASSGIRIERTFVGDVKKRINRRKCEACGEIVNDLEICRRHWFWLTNLAKQLKETKRIPSWLS
jgi:superfamily II DNA or RNA helicase